MEKKISRNTTVVRIVADVFFKPVKEELTQVKYEKNLNYCGTEYIFDSAFQLSEEEMKLHPWRESQDAAAAEEPKKQDEIEEDDPFERAEQLEGGESEEGDEGEGQASAAAAGEIDANLQDYYQDEEKVKEARTWTMRYVT